MSGTGEVLRTERVTDEDGSKGLDVVVDPGGGQNVTAPVYTPPGYDAVPLPGDFASLSDSAGSGAENAVGFADVKNAGLAAAGEVRVCGRDSSGTVKVSIWLKGDGSIVIANDNGSYEMAANGDVTINGVVITSAGEVTAPGEITAMAASPATSVTLSQHIHPTGVGPSSPATPGT